MFRCRPSSWAHRGSCRRPRSSGFVGDPADRFLADRGAVDFGEVRADLPAGQPLRIQGQDDLIDPGQPALPLLHDLRLERSVPVAGYLDLHVPGGLGQHRLRSGAVADVGGVSIPGRPVLLMAEVIGHLLVQRCLQHTLGELLQQPVRARQGQALLPGQPDQLIRGQLLRGGTSLLLRHNLQCRHHGTFPADLHQRVGPETPLSRQSRARRRRAFNLRG